MCIRDRSNTAGRRAGGHETCTKFAAEELLVLNLCAVRYPTLSPLASCWCGSRGCDRSVAARWHVCPSFHACDEMPGSQLAYRIIASRPASLGDMEITQEMLRGDVEENKAPSRPSWPRYPRPGCARSRILPQECWSLQRIPGTFVPLPCVRRVHLGSRGSARASLSEFLNP